MLRDFIAGSLAGEVFDAYGGAMSMPAENMKMQHVCLRMSAGHAAVRMKRCFSPAQRMCLSTASLPGPAAHCRASWVIPQERQRGALW